LNEPDLPPFNFQSSSVIESFTTGSLSAYNGEEVLPMKRSFLIGLLLLTLGLAGAAQEVGLSPDPAADKNQDQSRNVVGQVLNKSDSPISEAVVYLKNTKTLTIRSFISEKDGGFRFHGLSQNIDYEIYADFQGQKSPTKTISSFDTRTNITLNIHIDAK
jgi:hypothetical protein